MGLTAKLGTVIVVLLCFAAEVSEAHNLKTFPGKYGESPSFYDVVYYSSIFEVKSPATISNGALQVTPDSINDKFSLYNKSGRVLLDRPFKLWDGDTDINSSSTKRKRVASFNTSFLINVHRLNPTEIPGEGLAFVIAPDKDLPPGSDGQYLGLTNSTTDGNSDNQLVAIELDTFKQDFDPDDNHVGLNINSVRSTKNVSLTPLGFEIAAQVDKFYNVWIQYDGLNKVIEVYIEEQANQNDSTPSRPPSPVLKSDLDLRGVVNQNSYFGFSASTGKSRQLNCVLRWNLTVEYYAEDKHPWLKIVLGAGVPTLVLLLMGAVGLGCYLRRKRLARFNPNILGALKSLPGTPREFEFKDLKKATNNFDDKNNKLGQGGFGVVYRGWLPNENLEVAVKWFSRENIKGQDDFLSELTIINRLRHKHLVRLLGWCHKNGKLLLVYEYMPKGSLDQHLFGGPDTQPLSWNLRYKIISGVASALHYLHNEYDQTVVHRDLKASNIMLDADFNARLGDFGLARALDNEKTSYAEAEGVLLGTVGYIAPECFHTSKATQQSDVYAFGAVLMELVCGLRPGTKIAGFHLLVDWVWYLYREGRLLDAVDERLGDDYVEEEAERILLLGLACSHPIAGERPKTQAIVQIISASVPPPYVPPFKPAFVWPAMVPMEGEDISHTTTLDTTSITTSHFGSVGTPQCLSRESYVAYTSDNSLV
uniref:Putative clade XVI lectin receptor kinase n=1 Tax=Davidia involucrata TaxID=16924 RepID=A0A5B6ZVE4_DAVIN